MSKNRIVPHIYQLISEPSLSNEVIKLIDVDAKKLIKIYPVLTISNNNIKDDELIITKNVFNGKGDIFGYSIVKGNSVYNLSAPYEEMSAEYKIYNVIHNNFISFYNNTKSISTPSTTIITEKWGD